MNGILGWARPRRWSILNEAALAALLALIAVPIYAIPGDTDSVDIVTAYLEALREGDIETAREHILEPDSAADADTSWLTADAVSSSWEIESVEQRTRSWRYVHATITAGDLSEEMLFRLEREPDEQPLITNPYAFLNVSTLSGHTHTFTITELELNGHIETLDAHGDTGLADIALFPGAYTVGGGNDLLSDPAPPVFLAPAQDGYSYPTISLDPMLAEALVGNSAVEEQLNADLAAWIDLCVQNAEPAPDGCPFSAGTDYGELSDGDIDYTDPRDLTWEVETYPRMRFATNPINFAAYSVEMVEPGGVTMTASAHDPYEDEDRRIAARCRINVDGLVTVLLPNGRFEFEYPQEVWNTCRPT